jgi:hypothetical protein
MHPVATLDRGLLLALVVHDEHVPRHDDLHGIVTAARSLFGAHGRGSPRRRHAAEVA